MSDYEEEMLWVASAVRVLISHLHEIGLMVGGKLVDRSAVRDRLGMYQDDGKDRPTRDGETLRQEWEEVSQCLTTPQAVKAVIDTMPDEVGIFLSGVAGLLPKPSGKGWDKQKGTVEELEDDIPW